MSKYVQFNDEAYVSLPNGASMKYLKGYVGLIPEAHYAQAQAVCIIVEALDGKNQGTAASTNPIKQSSKGAAGGSGNISDKGE